MRWKFSGAVLCVGFLGLFLLLTEPAVAQKRAWPVDRLMNGARVRVAFAPITKGVRNSVVRVLMDGQTVALGTVFAPGLVLTKASEIQAATPLQCQQGKSIRDATRLTWSQAHDLAVLQVDTNDWKPIEPYNGPDPEVGHFVIAAQHAELPIAVGVVSVTRREIEKEEIHGVLGIQLEPVDEPVVKLVFEGSAAATAGIQPGDRITKVGEVSVTSRETLIHEIARHPPGEKLTIELLRDDKPVTLSATLSHPFGEFLSRIAQQNRLGGEISRRAGGFPIAIQHDSVLKPDECGGPALDIEGHVIGINIARSGRTESLLIPATVVQEVLASHAAGTLPAFPNAEPAEASPKPPTND
ncbi:MAG: PDZ domain-containing protein [Planctomycetota bacterium]|nr:MAG: PDZ domain-containing protein [Planctomycetota bacterium]